MSIEIGYNTSRIATAVMFAVRPRRRKDRIELMRPIAEELADTLRRQLGEAVTIVPVQDDSAACFIGNNSLTAEAHAIIRAWQRDYSPLVAEHEMVVRMTSDEGLAMIARLDALTITDSDVAVSVAHEVASVAIELVPAMLDYVLVFNMIAPYGPFDPETRGYILENERGNVDQSSWLGHVITLPMDSLCAGTIVHEVAHAMCHVSRLEVSGHSPAWGRAYNDMLAEFMRRGTEDVLQDIVAGRSCSSSVAVRERSAIPISAGGCTRFASISDLGLPEYEILGCLVECWPEQRPERPIYCPYTGVMELE